MFNAQHYVAIRMVLDVCSLESFLEEESEQRKKEHCKKNETSCEETKCVWNLA
ncbi:MAG: hypothetical protein LBR92_02000 [Puniceicoccales bacterium]|jgi:hypothetical protein|nr:hypothetical protein [Puniceicoccales bacterium]